LLEVVEALATPIVGLATEEEEEDRLAGMVVPTVHIVLLMAGLNQRVANADVEVIMASLEMQAH